MWELINKEFDFKKILFGKLSRRITFLFVLVGVVAPAIGIYYFYSISSSIITNNPDFLLEQSLLLQTTAVVIIALIALDAGIMGFFVSRSIARPIADLHNATREIEKGNFTIRTKINTNDEIGALSHAFNKTTMALSKMEEERRQIDKAKTEFLSITSHELRTPITPMKAQLQMLENEYFGKLSKKQKESISVIMRNAERLDRIIEDFLEISRIEAARLRFAFRQTDLRDTMNDTVGMMEGFAKEKNIQLEIQSEKLPMIEVDPDRVSQVLRNLVHNAIKFSHENSKIEVHAITKKDHILFGVKDCGVGMSSADKIQIFEPFYQVEEHLNRKHGGTGLGLAICRGIIESQKGKIWVESKQDQGSTFYFTIPLKPVYEIEPIKVLFSPKTEIEAKIKDEFTSILGPIGIVEFDDLKAKNALGSEDIFDYIDTLQQENILNSFHAQKFKQHIGRIFGNESISKENLSLENIEKTEKR